MTRIIEAGHYYLAKGPTKWSKVGWSILESIKQSGDQTLLMIDDVHSLDDMSESEQSLVTQTFDPSPDILVYESELVSYSRQALGQLKELSKKKRARKNGNGKWFCSGMSLTDERGRPLCLLYDAGLSLLKSEKADGAINILPYFYQDEQVALLRIMEKILPDFCIEVILFDLGGKYWKMEA